MSHHRVIALIVAAGRGERAGADGPKQYKLLCGRAVLAWAAETFLRHPQIDGVRVVIHRDDDALYREAMRELANDEKLLPPVVGGAERQDSVRLGLESLRAHGPQLVLIHDAARPFIDEATVTRVLAATRDADGALAALAVHDSMKRESDGGFVGGAVSRDGLWRAQTPQAFQFEKILDAHRTAAGKSLTDDAAVAEQAGLRVRLATGSPDNMKITIASDFNMAELLLSRRKNMATDFHTGNGYDVHAFAPGDAVTLCGVAIPHDQSLKGHSDADVGMHALTDAILGALSCGDIGDHFPPSDPQWKGAPSRVFLDKASALVNERGGRIVHCDVTLICEAPKIGPHRDAMRAALAEILQIEPSAISVKATTTEKLGFTGRGEGIAALATATIALPARGTS